MKKLGSFLLGLSIAAGSMVLGQVPISGLPPANLPLTGAEKVVMTQTQNGRPVTVQATVAGISPITVVPVQAIQGGTGEAGTITGVPMANGTSPYTAATAAQIAAPFTGCSTTVPFLTNTGTCSQVNLGTQVTGITLPVNGGTGEAGTFTGVRKANTLSSDTAALISDILALASGSCSATTFLSGTGACGTSTPGATFTLGGATVGSPTGGAQGAGTLNMTGCFVNGVACSVSGGSVTSISAGTGITLTPNPIVTTGSVALTTPVSVANGGSGTATPALVAGTNVTITGSWPNQTINSTSTATPGGANTQVQYNNAGAFGGNSGFTYDGSGDISLTGNVVAAGTNNLFGATSAQSFGTNINARTDGSHFALHQSVDANGNQICIGLNVSGSTQCNILTGNFGIGYNTVLPFGIYRNGVSQLGFSTAGAATFVSSVAATSFSGSGSGLTAVPDSALTANVTKYTDSGTNFTGGTPPTIGGSAICVASGTNCPAGSSQTTTTASVGTVGVCTGGLTAGNMRFVKQGNMVTASWSGTQLQCTTAAVSNITFTAIIPAGYVPTNTNGCAVEFTTSTTGYMTQENFASSGAISISVLLNATTQTQWFSAGSSCSYVLN